MGDKPIHQEPAYKPEYEAEEEIPTIPVPPPFKFKKGNTCRFHYKPAVKVFIINSIYDKKAEQNFYIGRTFSEDTLNNVFIHIAESELEADERASDKETS